MFRVWLAAACAALVALLGAKDVAADSEWRVTPRLWYALSDATGFAFFRDPALALAAPAGSSVTLPIYGASVTYTPETSGGPQYSVTVLHGEATDPISLFQGPTVFTGLTKTNRTDVEAVAQFPISDASATWLVGVRHIQQDVLSDGLSSVFGGPGTPLSFGNEFTLYLAELGFATSTKFGSESHHRVFGVLNLLIGTQLDNRKATAFEIEKQAYVGGFDVNAGYAYALSDELSVSARYRIFVLSGEDFNWSRSTTFVHGPEISVSVSLN